MIGGMGVRPGLENILDKRYRLHGSGIDSTGWNLLLSLQLFF